MKRKIIEIDEEKCSGCGTCAEACHEGAIQMVNGKAKLMRDDHCDGLGDCLPVCPEDAIHMVEREAEAYDPKAAAQHREHKPETLACGCPGTMAKVICRDQAEAPQQEPGCHGKPVSRLAQWPVQIKLVNVTAPYFDGAKLLVAADCTAFAYGSFHEDFIKGRITLVGCPKLDAVDYTEKLTEIIRNNTIKTVTIVRMEVPCCGGLEEAVKNALQGSGKMIPWQVVTIATDGRILD